MAANKRKLTPKQRSAILELVEGKKVYLVAESVGGSERTLFRWLANEHFSAELRKAELQVLDAVGLRLVSMAGQAVEALQYVLESPSSKGASVKRLTAKDILELLLKWREQVELEERITNLEHKVLNG